MLGLHRIGVKEQSLRAVVTRKDGTVEDLGVIAYWHRNPLKRWHWQLSQFLRGRRAGRITQTK